jgi:nucleoside-diphosphate-sugar epimerase
VIIDSLTMQDRVLVLGASGWFGRTFLRLLAPKIPVMTCASAIRDHYVTWDDDQVQNFNPTVVANFAFLTRDRISEVGIQRFIEVNSSLTKNFIKAAQLPSVKAALTVSSGAAVAFPLDMETNPYGVLKKREEDAALDLVTERRSVVVARAWSVSGPDVRTPRKYAFSDLVLQAKSGVIQVNASQPVFRRYVGVEDFLEVSMARLLSGWSGTIDSGGELIEVGELADRIRSIVNPQASISRLEQTSTEPSIYASDDVSWREACGEAGINPSEIDEQIREVANRL